MAGNHQRQSSQRSYRYSRESSVSPHRGDNVFSDENAVDFMVADGYQPTSLGQQEQQQNGSRRVSRRLPSIPNTIIPSRDTPKKKPTLPGASQPLIQRNSFSLRHDAQFSDTPRRQPSVSTLNTSEPMTARPLSIVSRTTSAAARPQSQYDGASAPSHPYGMYPQNTVSQHRGSVTSSYRPVRERSYNGGHGPTHPYGMYPQTTVDHAETDALAGSADIASVGFPGLTQQYARRLGPEGEEADDIVGPDGHTEQLPPYTKYPDAGPIPQKNRTTVVAPPLTPIPQGSSSSQAANSATSIRDTLLTPIADGPIREPILPYNENPARTRREKWSEKSKQRTCFGKMPVWVVGLLVFLLITLGAVLGGVIGRFLGRPGARPPSGATAATNASLSSSASAAASPSTSATSTFPGAVSLTSPIIGPTTIPLGTDYSLWLGSPSQTSNTCLQAQEQVAWGCTGGTLLGFAVENPMSSKATVKITPRVIDGSTSLRYGDQSAVVDAKVQQELMADSEDLQSGAAFYFNGTYDKQVILRYGDLNATNLKRSIDDAAAALEARDGSRVGQNEMVWSCFWNQTRVDGFIYVNKPVRSATTTTPVSGAASSTSTASVVARDHNWNRDMTMTTKDGAPVTLYTRQVKLREYRFGSPIKPYCTAMQYINGTLCPLQPGQQPLSLVEEEPSFGQDTIVAVGHVRRQDPYIDIPDFINKAADGAGFCQCEWIIT